MIEELKQIENIVFSPLQFKVSELSKDNESEDYFGYNFKINHWNIKFRKAKITPKKVGQFVALWKRNSTKQTEPFDFDDNFDFYIILTETENNFGFFFFPKSILSKQQILTTNQKEGKRGFRVYPNWDTTENKQAQKTQKWQTEYFINFNNSDSEIQKKFETKFNLKQNSFEEF